MPQASDYPTLYRIESAIETAVSTLFTAQSIVHHKSRATATKTAPFVDVEASLGEVTGRFYTDNDNVLRDASFNFRLSLRVVTNRLDDSTTHRDYRAKIRNVLAQYVADLNAELTYHAVAELHHVESTPEIETEGDLDVSAMQYAGVIDIKNDSWPVATP